MRYKPRSVHLYYKVVIHSAYFVRVNKLYKSLVSSAVHLQTYHITLFEYTLLSDETDMERHLPRILRSLWHIVASGRKSCTLVRPSPLLCIVAQVLETLRWLLCWHSFFYDYYTKIAQAADTSRTLAKQCSSVHHRIIHLLLMPWHKQPLRHGIGRRCRKCAAVGNRRHTNKVIGHGIFGY